MPEVKFFANIDLGGGKVEGLGAPSAGTDAANKGYVDSTISAAIGNAIAASY